MTREEQITEEFSDWLDRYTAPRSLQENEKARHAEMRALVKAILRFAPKVDYLSWLERVTSQLDYQQKTRSWPTVSEVGAVASNINKANPSHQGSEWTLDPLKIAAKRINGGEAVGDEWLYGRRAVELLASGEVHMDTLRPYRSSLYFRAKKLYGEEQARAMEADWIARHESAESHHRIAQDMPEGEPFNRFPTAAE